MPPSKKYSVPAGSTGFSLEVKMSSRPQQNSDLKQKMQSPPANQVLKSQGKQKLKSSIRQPYFDGHHVLRRTDEGPTIQPKSLKNSENRGIERKAYKKDELIKYMSNLPGYLQQVDKGENFPENALNFGVLDWNRLEKWKYSKSGSPRGNIDASYTASSSLFKADGSHKISSTIHRKSLTRHHHHPPSHHPRLCPPQEEGFSQDVDQSPMKVIQRDFGTALRSTFDEQHNPHQSNRTSSRNRSQVKFERGGRRDLDKKITSSSSGLRKNELPHSCKNVTSAQSKVVTSRVELWQSSESLDKRRCADKHKSIVLILPKHSPKSSCPKMFQTSEPILSFDGKPKANGKRFSADFSSEEVHSTELYSEVPHSCSPPIGVKKHFKSPLRPDSSVQAQKLEPSYLGSFSSETPTRLSQGKFMDTSTPSLKSLNQNGFGTPKSPVHEATKSAAHKGRHASPSRRFSFSLGRISRSLSFKENSAVQGLSPIQDALKSGPLRSEPSHCFFSDEVHSADFYPDIVHSCPFPTGVEAKDASYTRLYNPTSAKVERNCKRFDQEAAELAAVTGRPPSPNRRFSFSLGKMSRSFSFKEGLNIPQMDLTHATVKSGPVKSEVSDSSDTKGNKNSVHSRARSSPLRRLLDPLLKPRVSSPQSLTKNPPLTSKVIRNNESFVDRKPQPLTMQALLQVTTKNGLPLFKLVVNNTTDILVAMKNLNPSGKHDAAWDYTFYFVQEIKKKSGSWINQGLKEKSLGFGYNVVAQMKDFSYYCPESSVESSGDRFTQKECVLFSVDYRQGDGETPELVPNRELAAIIVRVPYGKASDDGDQRNKGKELLGNGFVEYLVEERNSTRRGGAEKCHSTTVILPGGDHGLPKKGVPSSLIQRWKSGGSCDCGGWDVGCKLQILTNEGQGCKLPETSLSRTKPDHFDLFNQGGAHFNKPIFKLAPFKKGIYSVEFSASISLLQAFSICIMAICNRFSLDLCEANKLPEGKLLETLTGCNRHQTPSRGRELPAKYVPSPPPSPVGRV